MQLSSSPAHSEQFGLDGAASPTLAAAGTTEGTSRGESPLIEPDTNSFTSDYSELGEPIRDVLADVQIIGREDLDLGNTIASSVDHLDETASEPSGTHHLRRQDNETEEQFARRVRKTNYLSLAQVR